MTAQTHILIIEDNAADLELMRHLLEASDHRTSVASEGEGAIRAARAERPDLILCGIQPPGIDGCEVLRRIRTQPELALIRVVAVTALAMLAGRDKVLAAGFSGYLSKPIDPATFVPQVKSFLDEGPRSVLSRGPAAS